MYNICMYGSHRGWCDWWGGGSGYGWHNLSQAILDIAHRCGLNSIHLHGYVRTLYICACLKSMLNDGELKEELGQSEFIYYPPLKR